MFWTDTAGFFFCLLKKQNKKQQTKTIFHIYLKCYDICINIICVTVCPVAIFAVAVYLLQHVAVCYRKLC